MCLLTPFSRRGRVPHAGGSVVVGSGGREGCAGEGRGDGVRGAETECTDQMGHVDDARSNAGIDSVGSVTGACPPVLRE
jgi:hypothetical protein